MKSKKTNVNVSVIIVTRNRKDRLMRCVQTVLANTVLPKELIIVDDGDMGESVMNATKQLKQTSLVTIIYRRVSNAPRGISYARNEGIYASKGVILAFVDDDCDVPNDWILSIWNSFLENPKAMAITGYILPTYPKNYWNRVMGSFHKDDVQKKKIVNHLYGANFYFRREVFTKHRMYFNPNLKTCSDDVYIAHILQKNDLRMLYDPSIVAWHDFRLDMKSIFRQWFIYGRSDYSFWIQTPSYNSRDAGYFRVGTVLDRLALSFFRVPMRVSQILLAIKSKISSPALYPGFVFIFVVYYIGVYSAYIERDK